MSAPYGEATYRLPRYLGDSALRVRVNHLHLPTPWNFVPAIWVLLQKGLWTKRHLIPRTSVLLTYATTLYFFGVAGQPTIKQLLRTRNPPIGSYLSQLMKVDCCGGKICRRCRGYSLVTGDAVSREWGPVFEPPFRRVLSSP